LFDGRFTSLNAIARRIWFRRRRTR